MKTKREIFKDAINSNDLATIEKMIQSGASASAFIDKGDTPLHIAARTGNIELAKLLLRYNADTSKKNIQRELPLDIAKEKNNIEMMGLLLEAKDKVNSSSVNSDQHLDKKPRVVNDEEIVVCKKIFSTKEILQELKAQSNPSKMDLYKAAILEGNINLVVKFMRIDLASSNIVVDYEGNTALHYGVITENHTLLYIMLSNGANISARNNDGLTCIQLAISRGAVDCIKLIAECIALDSNTTQQFLNQALQVKSEREKHKEKSSRAEYIKAVLSENLPEIKKHLEARASANIPMDKESCNTPLHLAIERKNGSLIQLLLSYNADINRINKAKKTPLQMALDSNDLQLLGLFLQHPINEETKIKCQPLLKEALKQKNVELILTLLRAGVTLSFLRTADGLTTFKSLIDEKDKLLKILFNEDKSGVVKELITLLGNLPEELELLFQDPVTLVCLNNPYILPSGNNGSDSYVFQLKQDPLSRQSLEKIRPVSNELAKELIAYYKQPWVDINVLPPCLICPQTQKVYEYPVVSIYDGKTYERSWFLHHNGGDDKLFYHNLLVHNLISERYSNYLVNNQHNNNNDAMEIVIENKVSF